MMIGAGIPAGGYAPRPSSLPGAAGDLAGGPGGVRAIEIIEPVRKPQGSKARARDGGGGATQGKTPRRPTVERLNAFDGVASRSNGPARPASLTDVPVDSPVAAYAASAGLGVPAPGRGAYFDVLI